MNTMFSPIGMMFSCEWKIICTPFRSVPYHCPLPQPVPRRARICSSPGNDRIPQNHPRLDPLPFLKGIYINSWAKFLKWPNTSYKIILTKKNKKKGKNNELVSLTIFLLIFPYQFWAPIKVLKGTFISKWQAHDRKQS